MDIALWRLWCCCYRKEEKKMNTPAEYGGKRRQFEIAPYGAVYEALRGTIADAGGVLQLHPAIGERLSMLDGCYGNWPASPTYHRFHPVHDFADNELDDDLRQLKHITAQDILDRSEGSRRMRIFPGPRVGEPMAQQMFEMANQVMGDNNGKCTFIKPLGPADWLVPLRMMFIEAKTDLSDYAYGNMDEFVVAPGTIVPANHPLSFRGMIEEEFIAPLVEKCGLRRENVKIPNPYNSADYDDWLTERGVDCVYAGVGWGVHVAFFDPSAGLVWELQNEKNSIGGIIRPLTFAEASSMGIMEITLDAVSNMQTALHSGGGNWYEALVAAYSIGLKQILMAPRMRIWMDGFVVDDQSWQRWTAKTAFLPKFTSLLPATATLACPDVEFNFAEQVAEQAIGKLH